MPASRLRFGIVILPEAGWRVTRERWSPAEEYGFDRTAQDFLQSAN